MKKFVFLFLATWLYGDMEFDEARSSRNDEVIVKLDQPLWIGGKIDAQYLAISAISEAGYLLSELKELVNFMKINKNYKLELVVYIGKTSKASTPLYSYDKEVAQKRGQNISNWLISNGIDTTRILINIKNNEVENELNRKVGFILFSNDNILSKEIDSKKTSENRLLRIFFNRDNVEINKKNIPELEKAIHFMNINTNYKLDLIGHSDKSSKSINEYNHLLAKKRAQNVANWLISKGINAKRINIISKGYNTPLAINHFVEGNELNRRVEFIFSNIK